MCHVSGIRFIGVGVSGTSDCVALIGGSRVDMYLKIVWKEVIGQLSAFWQSDYLVKDAWLIVFFLLFDRFVSDH